MTATVNSTCFLVLLLLIATALASVGAGVPTLNHALGIDQNDIRFQRHLRMVDISPATREDYDTFENRAFGTTTLKEVAEAGTKKFTEVAKNLISNAKLKLMPNTQLAANKLFISLKVDKVESDLLKSEQFKTWSTSVFKICNTNLEASNAAMVSTLTAQYGDEVLASMLAAAKEMPETRVVAVNMLRAQIDDWVARAIPADDVFRFLKLDKADKLLESPSLNRWIVYVTRVSKEDPYKLLFLDLAKRYNDEGLANVLVAAKSASGTKFNVGKLENLLLQRWVRAGKTADDVYDLLKLRNEVANKLLKNPALETWLSYVTKVGYQDPYRELFWKLRVDLGEEKVIDFILASKEAIRTKNIAGRLEEAQLNYWFSHSKTAGDAFTLLKLKNVDGDKLFESPTWSTWVSYLTKLNEKNPDEAMFLVLKNHYGDENLRTMIANAKKSKSNKVIGARLEEEVWRSEGKTAEDVFQLLNLRYKENAFLHSPALSKWISYATKLGKIDRKNPTDFGVIAVLEDHYLYADLARVFGEAIKQASSRKDTALEKVASTLQEMQFKKWMASKWDIEAVSLRMTSTSLNDKRNAKVIHDYSEFYKANITK